MTASRFIAAKIRISAQFHHERRCFFSRKRRNGRKGRKCCLELFELSSKKTTDVFVIKDNEDNLGQLVYQELENLRN